MDFGTAGYAVFIFVGHEVDRPRKSMRSFIHRMLPNEEVGGVLVGSLMSPQAGTLRRYPKRPRFPAEGGLRGGHHSLPLGDKRIVKMAKFDGQVWSERTAGSITTLGAQAITKLSQATVITQHARILRSELIVSVGGWTDELTDAPLIVGMCPNQFDATDLKEAIETGNPTGEADDGDSEHATRRYWIICQIAPISSAGASLVPNNGLPIVLKPRWTFMENTGWAYFVYNPGGSAYGASTKAITIVGKHFGVWVR